MPAPAAGHAGGRVSAIWIPDCFGGLGTVASLNDRTQINFILYIQREF